MTNSRFVSLVHFGCARNLIDSELILARLAEEMFPEYERRLETVQDHLSDPEATRTALVGAEQQADESPAGRRRATRDTH